MANIIVFAIIAVVIIAAALAAVFTKRIMRSVTALLFVLFAIAGLYFLLDYTFLGAAQLSIYAGGMTMIYIFAIQLLSRRDLQSAAEFQACRRCGYRVTGRLCNRCRCNAQELLHRQVHVC